MEKPLQHRNFHKILAVYLVGFFFALQWAIPVFYNSSFLNQFISEKRVALIYALGSILSIVFIILTPKFLKKYGNYEMTLVFLLFEFIALIGLIFSTSLVSAALFFVLYFAMGSVLILSIDIFLDGVTSHTLTGTVRGIMLTSMNVAWALSPLFAGFLLRDKGFSILYIISSVLILFIMFIVRTEFKDFKDDTYEKMSIMKGLKDVAKSKNLRGAFFSNYLLHFFYTWMVIYTPIYLYNSIGFSWPEVGLILSIMLLPFIFIEIPLGRIADNKIGEKEILIAGFIVMAGFTAILSFIKSDSLIIWAGVLFLTRIGASMAEIMSETYFFKIIKEKEIHLISFFRTLKPISYLTSSLFAVAFITIFEVEIKYLFVILAIVMILSLRPILKIRDTL